MINNCLGSLISKYKRQPSYRIIQLEVNVKGDVLRNILHLKCDLLSKCFAIYEYESEYESFNNRTTSKNDDLIFIYRSTTMQGIGKIMQVFEGTHCR